MIQAYTEILAADSRALKRMRRQIVKQGDGAGREDSLASLRLLLTKLGKVGRRIAYWNDRLRCPDEGPMSSLRASNPA